MFSWNHWGSYMTLHVYKQHLSCAVQCTQLNFVRLKLVMFSQLCNTCYVTLWFHRKCCLPTCRNLHFWLPLKMATPSVSLFYCRMEAVFYREIQRTGTASCLPFRIITSMLCSLFNYAADIIRNQGLNKYYHGSVLHLTTITIIFSLALEHIYNSYVHSLQYLS